MQEICEEYTGMCKNNASNIANIYTVLIKYAKDLHEKCQSLPEICLNLHFICCYML